MVLCDECDKPLRDESLVLGGKGCLLIKHSREHAWHVPRLCQPSLIIGRRRYTRVCNVRVAQCVYIALSGSRSQTSIEHAPFFVLGCEAPSVPVAFGVHELAPVYSIMP